MEHAGWPEATSPTEVFGASVRASELAPGPFLLHHQGMQLLGEARETIQAEPTFEEVLLATLQWDLQLGLLRQTALLLKEQSGQMKLRPERCQIGDLDRLFLPAFLGSGILLGSMCGGQTP